MERGFGYIFGPSAQGFLFQCSKDVQLGSAAFRWAPLVTRLLAGLQAPKKKVAPTPAVARKAAAPAKVVNPLYEKRNKTFGLGGAPPPKTDLHRFVKWPKYVRLQRQKRVLSMRLKVPPLINQFVTKSLDKNQAQTVFKLLMKYRPEDKKEKRDRLKTEAEARVAGKEADKKKPIVVKYGINHITNLVESGKAQMVIIAHDVDPLELVVWLPALCKKMGVPYAIVKGKARLGAVVHKKTATALALTSVKNEDQRELSKIVDTFKAQYNDGPRINWGGHILGPKSQVKTKQRERAVAKELAQRVGI
eukprot:gene25178-10813_t